MFTKWNLEQQPPPEVTGENWEKLGFSRFLKAFLFFKGFSIFFCFFRFF